MNFDGLSFAAPHLVQTNASSVKPFNIRQRLLVFGCDIIRVTQFLHTRGPIARALSFQILAAGTSIGANVQEADGASSRADFVAKLRIALKEAKETRFRLALCREAELLDGRFEPLLKESEELVRILGAIVHKTLRNDNV
jgi:four helix bundle protein